MMKLPLCGDSVLIMFMGGALMAVFGIAIVGIRAANLHEDDAAAAEYPAQHYDLSSPNLIYLLEMVIVVSVLSWRVFESCVELEEMHGKMQLLQTTIQEEEEEVRFCLLVASC